MLHGQLVQGIWLYDEQVSYNCPVILSRQRHVSTHIKDILLDQMSGDRRGSSRLDRQANHVFCMSCSNVGRICRMICPTQRIEFWPDSMPAAKSSIPSNWRASMPRGEKSRPCSRASGAKSSGAAKHTWCWPVRRRPTAKARSGYTSPRVPIAKTVMCIVPSTVGSWGPAKALAPWLVQALDCGSAPPVYHRCGRTVGCSTVPARVPPCNSLAPGSSGISRPYHPYTPPHTASKYPYYPPAGAPCPIASGQSRRER